MEYTATKNITATIDIVKLAKNGDKDAFVTLIQSNTNSMYRVAMSILHNESDTEDAIQNTISIVFEKLNKLKKNEFFKTWMIRILINQCKNISKRNNKTTSLENIKEESTPPIGCTNIDLYNAINKLPTDLRLVITLFYFEDMTTKDIAKAIGIPEATVRTRLFRARKKLSDEMKGVYQL